MQREGITKPIRLVYRLEKVFDIQFKGVGYLVETRKRRIHPVVYEFAYLLFGNTYAKGKFTVSHVFFCNTSYSRSCDSYFTFIIVLLIREIDFVDFTNNTN